MKTASTVLVLLLAGGCRPAPSEPRPPTLEDVRAHYASQPRYLRPLPATPVPTGLADLSAATCGACHTEIYEEWKLSTHAQAWRGDAQFLAELEKSEKQGVAWLCMNCHTPLENQLPRLVAGLQDGRLDRPIFVDNPAFDPKLQEDAITCATCHVKDGVVLGPWGDTEAPHPVAKAESLLGPEVCTQCHQAQARFDALSLVCVFDTGAEHAASPAAAAGKSCQSCHMPEVERPLWVGGGVPRKTRRHWFGGSLIPKQPGLTEALAALRAHYPPGLAVMVDPAPAQVAPGAELSFEVAVENREAGHMLPTGDPERFLELHLTALDPAGAVLGQRTERIGIVYQWYPEVKKLSDNRLSPGETRRYALTVKAPPKGAVTLRVEASRWRISEENLKYHHLEGRYVPGQTFFTQELAVPVAGRAVKAR